MAHLLRGRPRDALREADAARRASDLPSELLGAVDAYRLAAFAAVHGVAKARTLAEGMLAGVEGPSSDDALAGALNEIGLLAWEEGRLLDALGLLRAAAHRSRAGDDGLRCFHPGLNVSPVLLAAGDFDGAREAIADADRKLRATGGTLWQPGVAVLSARLELAVGALGAAAIEAERALLLAERLGASVFVAPAAWVLTSIGLLRGDFREAATQAALYRDSLGSGWTSSDRELFRWTDARLARAQGRDDRALELLADVVADPEPYQRVFLQEPGSAAWLVRLALGAEERESAHAIVACTEHLASSNPAYPSVQAVAQHARGLLEQDAAALDGAAAGHAQPWARASAYEDAATVLASHGDAGAQAVLHEAMAGYRAAGAEWDVRRVTRKARGVARRCGSGRRAGWGWAALTDAERSIAQLVADGRTNVEVGRELAVSRHTVDFHLRQIFRKLGISSRVALARIVGERAGHGPRR